MDKVMVQTSRIRTHCLVSGPEDGEPVLLVHGNITTGRFWQDLADGFPGGYRLVGREDLVAHQFDPPGSDAASRRSATVCGSRPTPAA